MTPLQVCASIMGALVVRGDLLPRLGKEDVQRTCSRSIVGSAL